MLLRQKTLVISIAVLAVVLVSLLAARPASSDSSAYLKLKDSRDALLIQQREVQRSYHDVQTQIDELRRRQGVLESYMQQLDRSIRDVDGAMSLLH